MSIIIIVKVWSGKIKTFNLWFTKRCFGRYIGNDKNIT